LAEVQPPAQSCVLIGGGSDKYKQPEPAALQRRSVQFRAVDTVMTNKKVAQKAVAQLGRMDQVLSWGTVYWI